MSRALWPQVGMWGRWFGARAFRSFSIPTAVGDIGTDCDCEIIAVKPDPNRAGRFMVMDVRGPNGDRFDPSIEPALFVPLVEVGEPEIDAAERRHQEIIDALEAINSTLCGTLTIDGTVTAYQPR